MNQVILVGRIVNETIEVKQTASGKSVANFTIAVDRKDKTTDFFPVVVWEQGAEYISKFGAKAKIVCVEGRVQNESWTDKDGNKRTKTEIIASSVELPRIDAGAKNEGLPF